LYKHGGNLEAFDPPNLHTRFNDRKGSITGGTPGFPNEDRDLSASSGSGNAGGNSTRRDVLTTWVLGVTSLLESLGDISANEDWRILATNHQHRSLSDSAKMAGNIWKQFEQTADWTFPSTSTLIEGTLEKVSAGETFQQAN
jgi:hypothetical protein